MCRQLDDFAFREELSEMGKEVVRYINGRCAHAVRVFQRDSLPLGQRTDFLASQGHLDLLSREAYLAADGGIDVHSERTTVANGHSNSDQLHQRPTDGPSSRAKDHVGQERGGQGTRCMRLNLRWIERAAEDQPEQRLNGSCEDSRLTPLESSDSGHHEYLSLSGGE